MDEKIIREFGGHSGCRVFLVSRGGKTFVKKYGDINRNVERLTVLKDCGYPVPELFRVQSHILEMEYLHGLDIRNFLIHNSSTELQKFILGTLHNFSKNSVDKDYTEVYNKKLSWITKEYELPFTKEELIERLPKILPSSMYHGDMTLENILFTNPSFHMIDAVTIEYDSYIFDIAKMRQDLECKWFLRKTDTLLDFKLQNIQDTLRECYPEAFNDNLLILMLLRVLLHTKKGDFEREFLMKEIRRLWK